MQKVPENEKIKWTAGRIINAVFWLYMWLSGVLEPVVSPATDADFFCIKAKQVISLNQTLINDYARFLGQGILPFLFWAGIDYVIRRRTARAKGINKSPMSRIIFSVLVIGIGIISIKSYAQKRCDDAIISQGAEEKITSDVQATLRRGIESENTTPKEKIEVARFMKTFTNKAVSQQHDYSLELDDAIGWGNILDFNRIKQDENLNKSKISIKKAKNIVQKYKTQSHELISNAKKDISSLNISEDSKSKMLRGFEETEAAALSQMDAFYDLENKIISEVGSIMDLLSERKGFWEIQDGNIIFSEQSDSDIFNSHISAIQKYSARENAIREQSTQEVTNKLNRLQELEIFSAPE